MVVVEKSGRHAMEATEKSKTEGIIIIIILTAVLHPLQAGVVKSAPETIKESVRQSDGTVDGRFTLRASVGRSTLIWKNPDTNAVEQWSHYVECSEGAENGLEPTFVMKHKENSMRENTSKLNKVWFVYSGASNHMTSHKEWFSYLEKPEQLGFVKTGDDAPHTMSDRRGS